MSTQADHDMGRCTLAAPHLHYPYWLVYATHEYTTKSGRRIQITTEALLRAFEARRPK